MALKLNVGVSRKIGLPNYGSQGASCQIEVELDQMLVFQDLEKLHEKMKQVFSACRQAVQDELCGPPGSADVDDSSHPSPHGPAGKNATDPSSCPALEHRAVAGDRAVPPHVRGVTPAQVRALEAIARRQNLDLPGYLRERCGVQQLTELTLAEASLLINELNSCSSPNGGSQL